MALEIKLNQKLSQSLVMTPQLQQAIKLLQLGRMEYLEVLAKELLENPMLEDAAQESSTAEQSNNSNSDTPEFQNENNSAQSEIEKATAEPAEDNGSLLNADVDWSSYMESSPEQWQVANGSRAGANDDEEKPSLEATLSKEEGLSSHIFWQLRTSDLNEQELEIAQVIVGSLDRNGYLDCSVEEIATMTCESPDRVEQVLKVVQAVDPAGVAARDLRECLLIQLRQLGFEGTLVWKIVSNHLEKLESRKYDVIAKEEAVDVEEVYEAIKHIQSLEPRPGRPFAEESPIYITPDIYVKNVDGKTVVSLNDSGMPRLRLSNQYRSLLVNGDVPADVPNREYIQDRLKSAAWLIKSIHQRQQTIYKVTESIFKHQKDFLTGGVSTLKPLVLRDIAEDVEMHESTVSRVTTNKYVHTPQGVFELKYFFSSGLRTNNGEVSSESVKDKIKSLIAAENPKKPLSDQAIAAQLKEDGIDIARRTVAKYREMMNILSSSRRKKVF